MMEPNHEKKNLKEALGITEEEDNVIDELLDLFNEKRLKVSWVLQRVWVDERLSDNAKCFAIFSLGRIFEFMNIMNRINEGGEDEGIPAK